MKPFIVRNLAWVQIAIQLAILLPVQPVWANTQASPFSVDRKQNEIQGVAGEIVSPFRVDNPHDKGEGNNAPLPYASELNRAAQMLSSGDTGTAASSLAAGQAAGALQGWLGQFGTARIQLNVDRHGEWGHSSGDLLVPLYDNNQSLLFIQGGIRKPDGRLTGNIGYGVRTFWPNGWMYGGNVFFDNDFTGKNRRVGTGAEAWTDYLRLSANIYAATTQWHTSRDFDGSWQEKPASGYDIRTEGWLPSYPQLGAKLVWEQYYGKQVALFDKDHLQRNPHAVTAGLEYTPFPLITLGVDQRQGRGQHDTQLALGVHWSFGHDWHWQTDAANVNALRTLAGNRYDLVNRNNEIVMQYRKSPQADVSHLAMTVVTDNSPADGVARNVVQVIATNRNGEPVQHAPLSWEASSSEGVQLIGTGVTDNNGLASATLTSTKVQAVPVVVRSGSITATQVSHFTPATVSHIALTVTQDNAVADGKAEDRVEAVLTDANGRPVSGMLVTWKVPEGVSVQGGDVTSDSQGKVIVRLTSSAAGSMAINASAGDQAASGTVHFTGNPASARISNLTVTTDGSPADGKTTNVAQVTVSDANGNALTGQQVIWKSDKSTVKFGQSPVTDASGITRVTYTDTQAETLTLTGTLSNGNSASQPSRFTPDNNAARLQDMTVTSGAKASGSDRNTATVTVTDADGNALADIAVTFSVTGSAKLSASTATTNSAGRASVTLTDTQAETVQVTAKLASGSSMTKDSNFVVDIDNAILTLVSTNEALADGRAVNTATITLKDREGKPLNGQTIALTTSGSAKLSETAGITDSNGQVEITLTDTVAETVTLTASVNGKQASATASFIGFNVEALTASADSVKADGTTPITLTATVQDANGKALANAIVSFSVTGSAKLSSTTATTNSNGQAQSLLTDTTGETVTVTARAQDNAADTGKTKSVQFIEPRISGIIVSGTEHTFSVDEGFPTTGYSGAKMTFVVDNSLDSSDAYTWQSDQPWVVINGVSATMTGIATPAASARTVTITATPKEGGKTLTYTFTLEKWYRKSGTVYINSEESTVTYGCAQVSGTVPYNAEITNGPSSSVGTLFGEWRDAPSLASSQFYFTQNSVDAWRANDSLIPYVLSNGSTDATSTPGRSYVMCRADDE